MAKKNTTPQIVKQIQRYKPVELNPAFQKQISYSQLSTYLNCPKKWEIHYKNGAYKSQPSMNMTFGTAIHATIQNYLTVMYNESGVRADEIDIEEYFENALREAYQNDYEKNKKVHFSNPVEMREFYDDGVAILRYLKKQRKGYFGKRGWYLVGCEIPILINKITDKPYNNVYYKGFIDVVLYHEGTNKFVIYDLKTSTRGWGKKEKGDETKQMQLVLYKNFFSQQFNVPIDDIDIEFFILKRKVYEDSEYPSKRIQQFVPASGKNKLAKGKRIINDFIESCFNQDGTHKDTLHISKPDKFNCKFCAYNKGLCKDGIS